MNFPLLKTKRTKLVQLTEEYLTDLYQIFSDERVTEYMDINPMKSIEETKKEWIDWSNDVYNSGYGIRWGILYGEQLVGTCGLHNIREVDDLIIADIGYDLAVNYWGQGIVSEVVPTVIQYAFEKLDIQEIHACIYPENIKSVKSIQRLGFKYRGVNELEEICKDRFTREDIYVYSDYGED